MHELSVAQSLFRALELVCKQHGASRVRSALVEVGPMSNVVPELLEQAFATLGEVEPTMAEVELRIRRVSLEARCEDCGHEGEIDGFVFRCPRCRGERMKLTRGDELTLRDVELEIEEDDHEPGSAREDAGAPAQVE